MEWMVAPEGFDDQCKSQFGDLVRKALDNELDDWATEAKSCLALVVLLDQLPRNIYRGTPESFSGDVKAAEIAVKAIAQEFDKSVTVIEASAFYIPLLHQENLISLVAARSLIEALKVRSTTDEENDWVDKGIAASKHHAGIVMKFGRYPTRNAILERKNTEAEEEFLETNKSLL
jgi:uncharacterized protein (DUF924 family)